jgi:RNA polymerase sigma-70 factor, ECF subfamily
MVEIRALEGTVEMGSRTPVAATGMAPDARRVRFEELTQGRLDRAYRFAAAILRDPDEAQDAVHDAAVAAWADWDDLRDVGRFDAWFDRIVVNRCRDRLRRRRVQLVDVELIPDRPGPDAFARMGERDALGQALGRLDVDHRIAVVLRFAGDLTIAEIANRTGEREGTVKSRLHYALRHLRAAYDAAERQAGGAR